MRSSGGDIIGRNQHRTASHHAICEFVAAQLKAAIPRIPVCSHFDCFPLRNEKVPRDLDQLWLVYRACRLA
jgi:hypothetical protein